VSVADAWLIFPNCEADGFDGMSQLSSRKEMAVDCDTSPALTRSHSPFMA
jgi:hypothetical protein